MTVQPDVPRGRLVRWAWALVAGEAAAIAFNAAVDNREVGDPKASIGHALIAIAPPFAVVVLLAGLGVLGMQGSRGRRRTRTAFVLVMLGGSSQAAGLAWTFVSDVTTRHRDDYVGLLLVGMAASLTAVVWLTDLWRRRDRRTRVPTTPVGVLLRRWGPSAYLMVFSSLAVLAVLAAIIDPPVVPDAILAIVSVGALLSWIAVRAVQLVDGRRGSVGGLGDVRPERPGDPATERRLGPAGEGRIGRSWRLTRTAWDVLRSDRTMIGLASASVLISVAATVAIFWLAGWFTASPERGGDATRLAWLGAVSAWPLTFVGTYLNVALAAAASQALDGGHLGVREALAVPTRRIGQIALWSLLAAGVGVVLQEIAERLPGGGRLASWILGAAWGLVTFFAVPILALEGCTATRCVTRSTRLIRQRWGEGVSGTVAISAWAVAAGIPAGMLIGVGVGLPGPARAVVLATAIALLLAIGAFSGAVRQVFAVVLYRYASDGDARGGFVAQDLERPFTPKRRWLRPDGSNG